MSQAALCSSFHRIQIGQGIASQDRRYQYTPKKPSSYPSDTTPTPKGTPPTISTHDIEEYVQPLYMRGWGLSLILPYGNGVDVLRKRFDFGSVEALEEFLADLCEYEEKKQIRFHSVLLRCLHPYQTTIQSISLFSKLVRLQILTQKLFSITQRRMCMRANMPSCRHWTHVVRRRSDADVKDKDDRTQ
jgi:hypothetical protein